MGCMIGKLWACTGEILISVTASSITNFLLYLMMDFDLHRKFFIWQNFLPLLDDFRNWLLHKTP